MLQEQLWCRHYTGAFHHTHCEKGHCYTDWNNGSDFGIANKIPCLTRNKMTCMQCVDFDLYTIPELEEQDRKARAALFDYISGKIDIDKLNEGPGE